MNHKMLIVLGSPRKKGNSSTLAAKVAEGATTGGAQVERVFLNGLTIKPCQGCEKCQKESFNLCAIEDDMNQLYSKLREADSIVLASPIYWFNISALFRSFLANTMPLQWNRLFDFCFLLWASDLKGIEVERDRGRVCPLLKFLYLIQDSHVKAIRTQYPNAWYHVMNRNMEKHKWMHRL